MAKHAYYMTQRPFSIGAQPKEGFVEPVARFGNVYKLIAWLNEKGE